MKSIFKRGMSLLSAAAMAASLAAVVPVTASAASIPADTQTFLKSMGAGWVLGNTFDATGSNLNAETSWQKDKTTEEAIKAVHAAGFETIRIPVSWGGHMSGDYVIDQAWLDRVHEVVDWAYNDGMYVIINIHHDNLSKKTDWAPDTTGNKFGFYPDSEHKDASIAFVNSIWSKLAEDYKDYGERLIFETLNEPRLCGTNYEWWFDGNNPPAAAKDAVETIDAINQAAVNTIRASGGNNSGRYIIVPGYSASITGASLASMPSDPGGASGRILRSIHCYDPNSLCLGSETDHTSAAATAFNDSAKVSLQSSFSTYKSFADKGIPVVIDEMGISDKQNETSRAQWAQEAFRLSKEYTLPCVMWDNNAEFKSSDAKGWNEHHRHLNRRNGKWVDPKVINAIMDSMGVTSRTIAADESVVAKKDQTISGVSDSYSKTYGDADFTLNAKSSGDGIISYSSSDTSVVSVTSAGKVSIKKAGSAEIEISATETATCNPASKKVKITVDPKKVTPTIDAIPDQDYTGSAITPEVKVHGDGKVLSKGYYDVTYKNNVDPGTATVTVTLKGNYTGSASTTFKINGELTKPGKVIIKTATAGTSYVKLSWNAASDAVGYRVYRYDDTKKKYVSVKTLSDTSYKDTGLSAAKEYKYKVRAYNKINSTMVWGSYSAVKSVLTKPKTPTISKVTKSTNAVKLTWKKVGCTGYQVQKYDAAKKKWVTVKTIKSAKTVSYKVTGLKKNTSYKLRVRAYKTSGSLKSYSAWSKKTVKTKK